MSEEELRQSILDQEHLKLLSVGYLVSACLSAFSSLFGLMYVFMGALFGALIARSPVPPGETPPPAFIGLIFGLFGFVFFAAFLTLAVLKFLVYRRLTQRRSRVFCMVVAGLSCAGLPYGTLLGVFTFLVLSRPTVMKLFEGAPPVAGASVTVPGT